ncbi:hypothetical protein [Burkholderia pseudomultivorans]|uniref:Uncharacterized protein n=1 Tax=Burkholderia pseudomultivorans TaxID=1207504 RepID=A0A132EN69_9BURK|nr:hypothetical protein [Burkholderia pseudomultivorans]KWF37965.1 hypothetical protein WT56_04560 [Burkholderia pseudomultivorans]VWB29964.1 hypothetical protein BPS26883_01290 [Burkholderia pseudomultivorans]
MHYRPDDLHRLFSCVPTLRLNRPAPAESFLDAAVAVGDELAHVLRDYPHVRYAPLDFHYLCHQSLCALDDALLADLTQDSNPGGWHGAHWAAFLIALAGDARYLPHLDAVRSHRGVQWAAGLADAAVRADAASDASRCCRLIVALRDQLAPLPRVGVRLRMYAAPDDIDSTASAVRTAYRSGDFEAALRLARREPAGDAADARTIAR